MFIDSREIPDDHLVQADLCIIGAGAAGITMASRFAAGGHNVCVIESGDLRHDDDTQALYQGRIRGLPYTSLAAARVRYFGGTTNHWSGLCRPLDPVDFEKRSWVEHSGWPVSYDEIAEYYALAQPYFGLDASGFSVSEWSNTNQPQLAFDADRLVSPIFRYTAPARFGSMYQDRLRNAENIAVYLHANVTSLTPDSNVRQIREVKVRCLTGSQFRVVAKKYVLATGGIENARILLSSDDVQQAGLGNQHDLVGRYFMDHPGFASGILLMADSTASMGLYTGASREVSLLAKIDGGNMEQFLSASEKKTLLRWIEQGADETDYKQNVEPVLRSKCVTCHNPDGIAFHRTLQTYDEVLRAARAGSRDAVNSTDPQSSARSRGVAGIGIAKRELAARRINNFCAFIEEASGWSEALDGDSVWQSIGNVASNFGSLSKSIYRKYFNEEARRQLLRLVNVIEPSPNPNSRVTLNANRDRLGMRRVDLDWRLNAADQRTLIESHDVIAAELGRTGLGRMLREFEPGEQDWTDGMTHGWHHMGTTRMHDDERQGVVDRNCRVHGLDNLYIAGSSVFPTYGYAQPTLTIVALALRLTDHLFEEFAR